MDDGGDLSNHLCFAKKMYSPNSMLLSVVYKQSEAAHRQARDVCLH